MDEIEARGVARLFFGAAAIVISVSIVSLAATYVARQDESVQVAEAAVGYRSLESLMTAIAVTHARLSEAVTASVSPGVALDASRVDLTLDARNEVEARFELVPDESRSMLDEPIARFLNAVNAALADIDQGSAPSADTLEGIDRAFFPLVERVDHVRGEFAARLATARTEIATLATAIRVFIVVVIPLLTLGGLYRGLRSRQRRREREIHFEADQALRSERNRLIQAVGHELRTPLTAVLGLSEELRTNPSLFPAEKAEMTTTIATQARELADRVDDLLVLSRIDTGVLHVRLEAIDVRTVIDRLIDRLSGTDLIASGRGTVRADPRYLEQVLRNLLTCARGSGSRKVWVDIEPGSVTLSVEVKDDGKPSPDLNPMGHGSVDGLSVVQPGVSLAAARHLTEAMGGTLLRTRSNGLNVSQIRLPLATATRR